MCWTVVAEWFGGWIHKRIRIELYTGKIAVKKRMALIRLMAKSLEVGLFRAKVFR